MSTDTDRSLFRQRAFVRLWWGQLFSITGDRFTYLALAGMLFEHSRHDGAAGYAALLAVLANVVVAPVLLFAPFTGAWVDRLNLKHVLVVADTLRAAIVLGIPIVYGLTGESTFAFVMVFLLFSVNVFFLPAKSAFLPEIVPRDKLLAANSMMAIAGVAATGLGALIGGFIIDRWGWAVAMRIDAASYFISVITLSLIPYDASARRGQRLPVTLRRYVQEVGDGWRLLRRSSGVTLGIVALGSVWFAGGVLHVAGNEHVQMAASSPGMQRLGVLLFAIGVGSGIGTWWINSQGNRLPRTFVLGTALVLTGLALVPLATSTLFVVFVVSACLAGMCVAPILVLSETVLQEGTTPQHRARVFSVRDFLMRLTLLGSVSATAWFSAITNAADTLLMCAFVLIFVGAFTLAMSRRRRLPELAPLPSSDLSVSAGASGSQHRR